jgi:thiol-disulfide isomerase/thioredoxin
MFIRNILSAILCLMTLVGFAQTNFTVSPEKPKPGDLLTITYIPAGDIANTLKPVEAEVYMYMSKGSSAEDLALTKAGSKYTATVQTDTGVKFLFFAFSADGKKDNNFNNGYYVLFYNGDKSLEGSYSNLSNFYQYLGYYNAGVERNNEKALEMLEKEIAAHPEVKRKMLLQYTSLINQVKKDAAPAILQKEVESILKAGLKSEDDYSILETLYSVLKLPEQTKLISSIKKEKFPDGKWKISDELNKFMREQDIAKKTEMLASIKDNIKNNKDWEFFKPNLPFYESSIANTYLQKKNWPEFKIAVTQLSDKSTQAQMYNSAAWEMQKSKDNLPLAEEFSRIATEYTKSEWKTPTTKKPDNMTGKQWQKQREFIYGMYADTYGMVLYQMGQYKKGLPFAKDGAIVINKGKDADQNNTYALLAEKVLPLKQYKKEIEQFVKDGKSSSEMKDILQRAYVKEKGSEAGFSDYIVALQKENIEKMMVELKKSMLSETAPVFALNDLDGKKIDITDLKGKVVVVDFWATWCGPCKASFPGMQKMVNKYKDDPNVKFVFIDTWENGEDKKKLAGDFITSNKYSFHVLLDNDNKVVEQFKVEGIPTKFVIDKAGIVRFKAVGFDGSDDKLMSELTAMIEMAASAGEKKAF